VPSSAASRSYASTPSHAPCPAPGLMETSNTRRIRSHGGTTEVPRRVT
jgi:hypothetical protein